VFHLVAAASKSYMIDERRCKCDERRQSILRCLPGQIRALMLRRPSPAYGGIRPRTSEPWTPLLTALPEGCQCGNRLGDVSFVRRRLPAHARALPPIATMQGAAGWGPLVEGAGGRLQQRLACNRGARVPVQRVQRARHGDNGSRGDPVARWRRFAECMDEASGISCSMCFGAATGLGSGPGWHCVLAGAPEGSAARRPRRLSSGTAGGS